MDPDALGRDAMHASSPPDDDAPTETLATTDAQPAPADWPDPADPGVPPPPPEKRSDRFGLAIPILLAALGLSAALIAWRGGVASSAAEDANRAGLDAARERAAAIIVNEGIVARTLEAFLDYERSRQRAEALDAAGFHEQALLERKVATSHWFLVEPDYLDQNGQLQPDRHRAALLADAAGRGDIDPAPHFANADAEYARIRGLILAGIVVVLALPFLTMAEITAGRLRLAGVITGGAIFAFGLLLAGIAWV